MWVFTPWEFPTRLWRGCFSIIFTLSESFYKNKHRKQKRLQTYTKIFDPVNVRIVIEECGRRGQGIPNGITKSMIDQKYQESFLSNKLC